MKPRPALAAATLLLHAYLAAASTTWHPAPMDLITPTQQATYGARGAQPQPAGHGMIQQQYGGMAPQYGGMTPQHGGMVRQYDGIAPQYDGTAQQHYGMVQPHYGMIQ